MFTVQQQKDARRRIEKITEILLPAHMNISKGEGVSVAYTQNGCQILAEDVSALHRGCFLVARAIKENRKELNVVQKRAYTSCGVMLDVSRGAVLTVGAVKRYMDYLAALGMNLLMLYTEDTYTIEAYPYFGYLRGRYSKADIREIDAYAQSLGIKLVPCIQTLAHLAQFLQWESNSAMSDQPDVLLVEDEDVKRFIEAEIRTIKECFTSGHIHIGMDEAHGLGLGRYMEKHGYPPDRFALLNKHLHFVVDVCDKYGLHPIMWSDMFFRLGSASNDYYDSNAVIPQSVIDRIPDVDMCYWDYYHTDQQYYENMLRQHARMSSNPQFAGGIWTWSGFLPHVKRTLATMIPALKACAQQKTDTVFAAMWGDDGAETDVFLGIGLLPVFSETCWQGEACPEDEIIKTSHCLTGLPWDVYAAMGELYHDETESASGKALLWADPLYPMLEGRYEPIMEIADRVRKALLYFRGYTNRLDIRYASAVLQVAAAKSELIAQLRSRYKVGDRSWLRQAVEMQIPELIRLYDQLMINHRALWERDMKRFGWEVLSLRYGAVIGRLRDMAYEISRYLDGRIPVIEELEQDVLPALRKHGSQRFRDLVTPACEW